MWTKLVIFLIGTLSMYQGISEATGIIYISEVMVESNVSLSAKSILDSWNSSTILTVTDSSKIPYDVTIYSRELVAECLVVGESYNCNCSTGYAWSNEVCYNYGCCNETPCTQNVSLATSICVLKTPVVINGSVQVPMSWLTIHTTNLTTELNKVNGLDGAPVVTITSNTGSLSIADFKMKTHVALNTSKLQDILNTLVTTMKSGPILVTTAGMVNIQVSYSGRVEYNSTPSLQCTFEETTGSAGWNLTRGSVRLGLGNGLVTTVIPNCALPDYPSCVNVTLTKVTAVWAGTYECRFTIGTITHTASSELQVAPLPDVITMRFLPLIADCSDNKPVPVTVNATIPKTTVNYTVTWTPTGPTGLLQQQDVTIYNLSTAIDCVAVKDKKTYDVEITFQNDLLQKATKTVNIPILQGPDACPQITLDGEYWPKTPPNTTVKNSTCPEGRIGYRIRYCNITKRWDDVVSKCVSEELGKVVNVANDFLNGLGATQEGAKNIFEGIKNSSSLTPSNSGGDALADVDASIQIFGVMAKASKNVDLKEDILPDLVDAASNMVNSSWGKNEKIVHEMSANYLTNVEDLVKNIQTNNSDGFNSSNLELRVCSSEDCSMSVFGIGVNMNKTNGTMKTMAVRNLMEKLRNNNFPGKNRSSVLLSATLVGNSDSNITIKMFFPNEQPNANEHFCVFWDTKTSDWSKEGCVANVTDDNQTLCECTHLTSFSVLMARSANVSSPDLDIITYVGLGVSVFSLLIFLFVESLVWSAVTKTNLSHFRHTAVVNIAVFRLLADCSFLASAFPDRISDTWCFTFTVCKHLFYLAMFTWMLCLSMMLVHQLIFVFSPVRKRVFMYLSSIVGYLLPIALVGTSYVYYKYTQQEYYDRKTCWLKYDRLLEGSIHAFLLPVGTIVLSNLFSMVVVIVTLVKTSVPDSSKADDKETAKSILKVVVLLTPVFGVTWIIGFVILILEDTDPMHKVANYSFTILNSFQGLFILITGCLAEQKVRQEVVRIVMVKTGRDTNSIKKLTNSSTTLYTKDK